MSRSWYFIFVAGYKPLYASPEVADRVGEFIKSNSAEVYEETLQESAFVDNPGMILSDRKIWSCQIDDLIVTIPEADVPSILESMKANRWLPKFTNRGWFNVYGWRQCIALSEQQYDQLIAAMESIRELAIKTAKEEMARLDRAIQLINDELNRRSGRLVKGQALNGPLGGAWN